MNIMKTLELALLCAMALSLGACVGKEDQQSYENEVPQKVVGSATVRAEDLSVKSMDIRIMSALATDVDPGTAQRDSEVCMGWTYSEEGLSADFSAMREVDQSEWGRLCYQYACSTKGAVNVDGDLYEIEVNAGGWIALVDEENASVRYFATDAQRPAFLAACDCCE